MKKRISWVRILLFVFVAVGLVAISRLLGMTLLGSIGFTLGAFMLILLGDYYAGVHDAKRERDARNAGRWEGSSTQAEREKD